MKSLLVYLFLHILFILNQKLFDIVIYNKTSISKEFLKDIKKLKYIFNKK